MVARTEMNEARRASSGEEPKSAGRDVGWIDCQSDGGWRGGSGQRKRKTRKGVTRRAQRVPVSEEGKLSSARVNSKSLRRAAESSRVDAGSVCVDPGVRVVIGTRRCSVLV